jgi:hypothetical protein
VKLWMGVLLRHGLDAETRPAPARMRTAGSSRGIAAVAVVGLILSACSSSVATGTPAPISALAATDTPAPTIAVVAATPAPSLSALATGVPTSLDPCQLVTSQEASQLAGVSYGAGEEGTTSGGGKRCVYGANTLNVFTVLVGQAPDVATAQAGKAEAQAAILQQAGNGVSFTEIPGFADGAAYMVGSVTVAGKTIKGSAIYVLKGTIFFGFSDLALSGATPTAAAMQAQAQTILGRLP